MKNLRSNSARIVRQTRSILSNVLFFGFLACGTMASAALPFYIHFHPEKFGPPLMQFSGELERDPVADINVERQVTAVVKPKLQLDKITTGSIRNRFPERIVNVSADQAFPSDDPHSPLTLDILFVSSNRALIIDGGKVETVRVGSRLSNGAEVEAIILSKGRWSIKTSAGDAYDWVQRK